MHVRGRYRDFAALETAVLGVLARRTRIATATHELLSASGGKPILYFPARFDLPGVQAGDGYAYKTAVDRYNRDTGGDVRPYVSTDAQAEWWGGRASGTVSHSYILSFFGDTAEAMLRFAENIDPDVPRIALVDTMNDCVGASLEAARAMFGRYSQLVDGGRPDEARRYRLFGVRTDTAANMVDKSVEPTGDIERDGGVTVELVRKMRAALDAEPERTGLSGDRLERARDYFRSVKIVATGGFEPERIARFERQGAPVDFYGVGSWFLASHRTDFTADVVRVKVQDRWIPMAKAGRKYITSEKLRRVAPD
jgi:nicotinate phosphoribosyltransferase